MVRILGLFQFGSSQNLKVWGCMTCSHLTSKPGKHQTQTASLLFKWRRCHCCFPQVRMSWPSCTCGAGVSSCKLTFSLHSASFLNMFCPASLIPRTSGSYTDFWLLYPGLCFPLCQDITRWNIFWVSTFTHLLSPNTLLLSGCLVLRWLHLPSMSRWPAYSISPKPLAIMFTLWLGRWLTDISKTLQIP